MMERNCLQKWKATADGHCYRRSLLTIIFGIGSDTPEKLQQFQYIIAAALVEYASDLDKFVAHQLHITAGPFKDYCDS